MKKLGPTANLFDLADLSADELKKLLRERGMNCDAQIDKILREFKKNLGDKGHELIGRATKRPGPTQERTLRESWGLPQNGPQ